MFTLASQPVNIQNSFFKDHPTAKGFTISPAFIVSTLLPNAIIVAGFIFLFMIVFAGFKLVVGAGANQSAQDAAKAKSALTWSIVGFLIVAFSYFILQLIATFLGFNFYVDLSFGLL